MGGELSLGQKVFIDQIIDEIIDQVIDEIIDHN
jgi:hypothetical protein